MSLQIAGNKSFLAELFFLRKESKGMGRNCCLHASLKVKQSRYTPWRRLGGEEV
jgi:hypothetical protein